MGLIKEPKNIDFSSQSEPWTEKELLDFRKVMQEIKDNKKMRKCGHTAKNRKHETA